MSREMVVLSTELRVGDRLLGCSISRVDGFTPWSGISVKPDGYTGENEVRSASNRASYYCISHLKKLHGGMFFKVLRNSSTDEPIMVYRKGQGWVYE